MSNNDPAQELAEARQIIARQNAELERLRRQVENDRFAEGLRNALSLAATTGTIASPVTHSRLLEMIVEAAAQTLSARAASLFLVDEENQELVFEVALGQKAAEVKQFRVPLGHGIAGLVARSGQPMAISNAQQDLRQAADIAQAVGYVPQSILCMPLFYNDQVIGVLELLDKEGAPSFDAEDMQTLSLFANQAAVAIEQSLTHTNLAALVGELINSLGGVPERQRDWLQSEARHYASTLEEEGPYRQALELAQLVQKIAWAGEAELKACKAILNSFAEYLQTRTGLMGERGGY